MSMSILAAALTLGPPTAHAAPAVEVGVGVVDVFEERRPSAALRAGKGALMGELSAAYNPRSGPSSLTYALTGITSEPWPEYKESWALKALADLGLPPQDKGWYGSPHLYLGMQARRVERTTYTLTRVEPVGIFSAEPPSWQLSPLIGVGISGSYGPITARATLHTATAPKLFDGGRELTHRGSFDLLYRF